MPIVTDETIEQEIQAKGLTAPRVTPASVEAAIRSAHFFVASDALQHERSVHEFPTSDGWTLGSTQLLTFCVIQLHNGFTVTGDSACASPENFDAELGRKIARQNAVAKIWPLLGFRLRDQLAGLTGSFDGHDIADAHRDSFAAGQAATLKQQAERA